ncbi:MAG TPA: bifunctional riboflavin kinase/FAD synthetase [Steroidobacteraceae bacterium]|nr:bifunctional riboflavin kinase/FAD synthetase [Steroidobacteraceae bacterium]
MELVRGLHNLRARHRGCAVTIGNFDGVHLGHRAMLERLCAHARRLGVPATVMTFEPAPREYFAPARAPARLTRLREKLELFAAAGVERCLVLRFEKRLQSMSGPAFVQELLGERLQAKQVVVGTDFKFGAGGEADVALLQKLSPQLGFGVDVVEPVLIEGERVSSSAIRAALARGDLKHAARLLGRPYAMHGKVIRGEGLGRKLGFPTANMRVHRRASPLDGIFAVRVRGIGPSPAPGVASLGTRPTIGGREVLLEAHVFDFDADLYGRWLAVEFIARLREERKFESLEAMVVQMHVDVRQARTALRT